MDQITESLLMKTLRYLLGLLWWCWQASGGRWKCFRRQLRKQRQRLTMCLTLRVYRCPNSTHQVRCRRVYLGSLHHGLELHLLRYRYGAECPHERPYPHRGKCQRERR